MDTPTIKRVPTDNPAVFAFRITGRVTSEDMHAMAELMNKAFDAFDKVSMVLVFEGFGGRETGATFEPEAMKAQFRSVAKVDKYVVVGAPESAAKMVEGFGKILPVDAQAFPREKEDEAFAVVGARPLAA